ncbi:hypothetical protein GQ42DRAFT_165588 [Ramicandelaber brevisporus]|nr:hypothetical protein GQ42DRAFT_165588 [Ramicandelaber brevisporus]
MATATGEQSADSQLNHLHLMTTNDQRQQARGGGESQRRRGRTKKREGNRWNRPLGKPGCQPHQPGGRGTTTTGTEHRASTRQHLGQRGNNAGA